MVVPVISFQECPSCGGAVGLDGYAELRLPMRTVHLLHCDHCAVGHLLTVHPDGRPFTMECRSSDKSYAVFCETLRSLHRLKTAKGMEAALAA